MRINLLLIVVGALAAVCTLAAAQGGGSAGKSRPAKTAGRKLLTKGQIGKALDRLKARVAGLASSRNPLYLRNKPDVDVRLWAIGDVLSKGVKANETKQVYGWVDTCLDETNYILDGFSEGRDYFKEKHGILNRAITVKGLDRPQPYYVHVPDSYKGEKAWPMFIYLHGGGLIDHAHYMLARARRPGKPAAKKDRQSRPYATQELIKIWLPRRDGAWPLAPNEDSVFTAIKDMKKNYNIDPDRIYVQGFSFGGHGTWHFAARYPDQFAAAGPSGPVRGGAGPFWVNLCNLPIFICQGSNDDTCPPPYSREMFGKLREAKYDAVYLEEVRLGHGTPAVARAAQEYWMLTKVRNRFPKKVVFRTDRPRYHKSYWIDILKPAPEVKQIKTSEWRSGDKTPLAQIQAVRKAPGQFRIKTDHIDSFAILLDAKLAPPGKSVQVSINGAPPRKFDWPEANRLIFRKGAQGSWQAVSP